MGIRKLLWILGMLFPIFAAAQQPQTQTAPIYSVNAKYANGVAPGYWSTPGAGLVLNVTKGTVNCAATIRTYAGGTLTMANNTTNYVFLDTTTLCTPSSNTSGFTSATIPLAIVVTSGGTITSVSDVRTTMSTAVGTGTIVGGTCTNQVITALTTSGTPTCTTVTSAYVNNSIAQTGVDINTSNQVTATHLSVALPVNQGGSGTTSTLTGVMRGGSPMTASELSGDVSTSGSNVVTLGSAFKHNPIGTTFGDTGGSALTSGSVVTYFYMGPSCTIHAWGMTVDGGTATVDIWKIANGTAIPTVTNTITASALPAIASGTALESTTLTGWTTAVTQYDIFGFQLKTVATAKFVSIVLECNQ